MDVIASSNPQVPPPAEALVPRADVAPVAAPEAEAPAAAAPAAEDAPVTGWAPTAWRRALQAEGVKDVDG